MVKENFQMSLILKNLTTRGGFSWSDSFTHLSRSNMFYKLNYSRKTFLFKRSTQDILSETSAPTHQVFLSTDSAKQKESKTQPLSSRVYLLVGFKLL